MSDVKAERVEWLWQSRLPLGKIVTADGDPGLGKSTLALSFAATVTTGGQWPTGERCQHPGDVLLLSAEDGLADTVRPRLDAAGADVNRVHAIEGKTLIDPNSGERYLRPLNLADVLDLDAAMATTDARLLVVDVLMAFLPAGTDAHKDQDVRRVLSALGAAADRNRCTVLLLRHLNKGASRDPMYRGGGSIGIVGAARAGLLVAADPNDPTQRVLACVKSNLGVMPQSLAYRLVDSPDHGVARVEWLGTTHHDARGLLAAPESEEDSDERTAAEHWLQDYLNVNGPTASKVVKNDAAKERFSEATLKRAKKKLGVEDRSSGFPRTSTWYLPSQLSTPPVSENREPTEPTGPDQHKQDEPTERIFQSAHSPESEPTDDQAAKCAECGQRLLAPESLEHGYCERCRRQHQQTERQSAGATVTDLDSRRSPENGHPTLSAVKWFAQRIAELQRAGQKTVESFAVYAEGEALGYGRQSLIAAANRHPDVRVISRTMGNTTWCIDPSEQTEYKPAAEWVDQYLAALPPDVREVDRADLRAAGEAAGYSWSNVRKSAYEHPRIESRPAPGDNPRQAHIWHLKPAEEAS
ncbi:AAA family ATPase [Mycobacterium intermedium]|nr:AAA family ATPase [Mycobacterium intermedium]MCV6963942.1 AAA family ATPase [Mycobacterium intermedium]